MGSAFRVSLMAAVAALLCIAADAGVRDMPYATALTVQPVATISGSAVSYGGTGKWATRMKDGTRRRVVGFDISDTSTGGWLVLHCADQTAGYYDTVRVDSAVQYRLTIRKGFIADTVCSLGTTVKLGGIKFLF